MEEVDARVRGDWGSGDGWRSRRPWEGTEAVAGRDERDAEVSAGFDGGRIWRSLEGEEFGEELGRPGRTEGKKWTKRAANDTRGKLRYGKKRDLGEKCSAWRGVTRR